MTEYKYGQKVMSDEQVVFFVRYLSESEVSHVRSRTDDVLDCVINNDGVWRMFDSSNLRSI